jgi:hypothetical protein
MAQKPERKRINKGIKRGRLEGDENGFKTKKGMREEKGRGRALPLLGNSKKFYNFPFTLGKRWILFFCIFFNH